jgi:hypothetical protein
MGPVPGNGVESRLASRRPPHGRYWQIGANRRGYNGIGSIRELRWVMFLALAEGVFGPLGLESENIFRAN